MQRIRAPLGSAGSQDPQSIIDAHELQNNSSIGGKTFVHGLEYGFNDWPKLGLKRSSQPIPGRASLTISTALEGFLQLTLQGKYWAGRCRGAIR